jgi:hypothetical protein
MSLWLIALLFPIGVLAAFPLAVGICAVLGAITMGIDRLTNPCPGCGRRTLRCVNAIRETYPTGAGTGSFYICGHCDRRWFWSNDDKQWTDASADRFDRWFSVGGAAQPSGLENR